MQHHHPRPAASLRRLTTAEEVEAVVGRPASAVMLKQVTALDVGCRGVLASSPLAAFGYRDTDGVARTTFVGGAPGFARVHSATRFSFTHHGPPPAPGGVSLFFLLPGVGEILRVNGAATLMGRRVHVDVEQAYVHCAQAVLRSGLWQPPAETDSAPSTARTVDAGPLARPGVAGFLHAAPFLALSTWDGEGGSDTSPRGERAAVVRIIDGRTLVLADRKGNKRADTLHNLLKDDRLSLAALVPARAAVLHVHGRAAITDDPGLLRMMALRGVPPHLAVVVDVEDAVITANDALARAAPWAPGTRYDRAAMPDMMAVAAAHLAAGAAAADGGPPAILLRAIGAIPGASRLLRRVADRGYRSSLAKEGYGDIAPEPATGRRRLRTARPSPAAEAPQSSRAVRVAEVRRESADALTLVLEDAAAPGRPFDFRPGQYFTLAADLDGTPHRRAYSATSVPGAGQLHLTVKRVEQGRFSTHLHQQVRVGDHLAVRGPSGAFHAPTPAPERTVLIAAGSGITPMMSMIRTQLDAADGGPIALLYSSRTRQDVIFGDELDRLSAAHPDRLAITHVLTAGEGRLDEAKIRTWAGGLRTEGADFFVCGPEPLMDAAGNALRRLDIPEDRIHQERFTAVQTAAAATTRPQEMTVLDDGRPVATTTVAAGQSLLEAGLAAGVAMEHSCTVGNCGECMVRLRSGQVTQTEPNCLTDQQKADGYVLACTSCPLSALVVDIAPPQPDPPGA